MLRPPINSSPITLQYGCGGAFGLDRLNRGAHHTLGTFQRGQREECRLDGIIAEHGRDFRPYLLFRRARTPDTGTRAMSALLPILHLVRSRNQVGVPESRSLNPTLAEQNVGVPELSPDFFGCEAFLCHGLPRLQLDGSIAISAPAGAATFPRWRARAGCGRDRTRRGQVHRAAAFPRGRDRPR